MNSASQPMNRRAALKRVAAASAVSAAPGWLVYRSAVAGGGAADRLCRYLEGLRGADGGYGWADQGRSHLTPSYGAVGCYRVLGRKPPEARRLAEFIRTHHPARLKKLEQEHHEFEYQQIQSLLWLGEEASEFHDLVRGWKRPTRYLPQYEQAGLPIFRFESAALICRKLLGLPLDDLAPEFIDYVNTRRRENGSFNNMPADRGGDGHVLNTWWGLQTFQILGRLAEKKGETIEWLRACQLPGGGFTYQPKPLFAGNDGVAYTWAAVRALRLLGTAPVDVEGCVAYLCSLANGDGGFGDRPDWASNPVACLDALEALDALGAAHELDRGRARMRQVRGGHPTALPEDGGVFSIQLEAHGQGSPTEAVDLAASLKIHLWGAKNAKPAWLERAQAIADERGVLVRFFASDEEYGTWVAVPGLGTYSHTSDIIAPAGSDFGRSLARQGPVSWNEFRERRWQPLEKAGGRLIWQFGENEELVRLYLDDSLARGGYAAISTFHFGNPDFTNSEPFLLRYRGQLPFVALQDAHGLEPWWFADMTAGFRTLFVARQPTWEGWLEALQKNWVVAVRHDAVSGFETWMHGGARPVLDFVQEREVEWRWWNHPAMQRPAVSIVPVFPEDEFEAARPERGVAIRVRCAWENTTQGLLKKPRSELVRIEMDGALLSPVLVESKPRPGVWADHYHVCSIGEPGVGEHSVTAWVRWIDTGAEVSRTIRFRVRRKI